MDGKVKCLKCGRDGLVVKKPTVTKVAGKVYKYEKLYVAHYLPNGISVKSGKRVNRVQWCYLNEEHIAQMRAKGVVTQSITQNVTQKKRSSLCNAKRP